MNVLYYDRLRVEIRVARSAAVHAERQVDHVGQPHAFVDRGDCDPRALRGAQDS